jgi:hypothetical protein
LAWSLARLTDAAIIEDKMATMAQTTNNSMSAKARHSRPVVVVHLCLGLQRALLPRSRVVIT